MPTPELQSEGFCSFCERSIAVTAKGTLVAHEANRPSADGSPTSPCPGSELTPSVARDLAVIDALRSPHRAWPPEPDT